MAAMRSGPSTVPVGLAGELISDGLGAGPEPGTHGLRPELEGIVLVHGHVDRLSVGELDELRIARVVGIREHDLISSIEERREEQEHRWGRARGDEDLIGRHVDAVAPMIVLGDGLAQRQDAQRVRVARAPVLQRLLGGLSDHRAACRNRARRTPDG